MTTNHFPNARDGPLPPKLLTEKEVAEFLNVSIKTIQYWRVAGGGPAFIKIGRLVRYDLATLLSYIEKNRKNNTCKTKY